VVLGANGESSQALILVGSDLQARGEPLLRWVDQQNSMSTLFTLDDITEDMEWESTT
jgi:hypothetical protein